MHMCSIPQNLGNPVISVNYRSFLGPENKASLDARLLTIEGGRGYGPGSRPFYATNLNGLRIFTLSFVPYTYN